MCYSVLRVVPLIMVMGTIFFLSSLPGGRVELPLFPGADKIAHAIAYGVLAATTLYALPDNFKRKHLGLTIIVTVFFCSLYGLSDEYHQYYVPGRSSSVGDLMADTTGAVIIALTWRLRQTMFGGKTQDNTT